jgi:hypothetical protein
MVLGTQTGSGCCALWSGWTQLVSLCSVFFLGGTSHILLACWCPIHSGWMSTNGYQLDIVARFYSS